jgi:acyl dehydratase
MYGVDALGYSLMSIAMLFAAPVFVGRRLERWVRWSLITNGMLTPALLLQLNFPTFSIAAFWAITFPIATALLAVLFKRKMK